MFETIDPDRSLSKEEYDREIPGLRERIGVLQREFRDKNIPVLIVFEGWRVSGISSTINQLTYALDPRGYRVHFTQRPDDTSRMHPLLWRFWVRTPARGHTAIFDRSWYTDTLLEMRDGDRKPAIPAQAIDDIINMEHLLAVDGTVIIKIFLHISKKEQKKRLKKIREVRPEIIFAEDRKRKGLPEYDTVLPTLEHLISTTDTPGAPWTIIEANDRHFTVVRVFNTIIRRLEETLAGSHTTVVSSPDAEITGDDTRTLILPSVDLTKTLPEDEYQHRFEACERRLHELQYSIHSKKIPVIILFEGWDAAGKGGAIIRLDRALNPRCSVVEPIAAPDPHEKAHHYLWRFVKMLPKQGNITIFDRSWYGRVLVERVEGFCPEQVWRRAYDEINVMEDYLVRSGYILLKFWLHIDPETQLKRFEERETDPLKTYKITEDDWRNREKWPLYAMAVEDMLHKTSTPSASWTIVESNDKYYSRIKIMETVIAALESALAKNGKTGKKNVSAQKK